MEKKEIAVQKKHNGHNCAQAVLCAYTEETGLSEEILKKIGAAYGAGMGKMGGTCGALCGAAAVLGLRKFEGRPIARAAGALYTAFAEKCGATICRELKGIDTGVVLCPCDDCVRHAVEALEDLLAGERV